MWWAIGQLVGSLVSPVLFVPHATRAHYSPRTAGRMAAYRHLLLPHDRDARRVPGRVQRGLALLPVRDGRIHDAPLLLALLRTTTQTKYKMKGGLFLNIVVAQRTTILKLLSSENQPLLVGRDAICFHD